MIRQIARKFLKGASWDNPVLNAGFLALDPVDWAVRVPRGLGHLPRYSRRIRSNGVGGQFGGGKFAHLGNLLANHLETHAGLTSGSRVLEIGCGVGRTAYALLDRLEQGGFTGMDIERVSIEDCQQRGVFKRKGFKFDSLDVRNDEYNPNGKYYAHEYRFPYDDNAFDVIFLVSVFTHMLTKDVEQYIAEISRMLAPGGHCMVTTFLMDHGREGQLGTFDHTEDRHSFIDPKMPEVAVGYEQGFFEENFAKHGVELSHGPIWGAWRKNSPLSEGANFGQDILFFRKPK